MKATILAVGTEILFGTTVNTNAVFLSQQLNLLGIDVLRHITIGDNRKRLLRALEVAFEDCDLVFSTGGLGPTEDDMTKETIAEFFGKKLVENKAWTEMMSSWFSKNGRVMSENNRKQAFIPEGASVLDNPNGTAPGFILSDGRRTIFVMPGPPREMQPMFTDHILPNLKKLQDSTLYYKMIRTVGIGESDLETALLDIIDVQTDPTIATYVKDFSAMVRVASKRKTLEEAQKAVEETTEQIRERIGKYIYSEDNEDLQQAVLHIMKSRGLTLSSAESITGGMFAKLFTDIPGSSAVLDRSIVTYSNAAKISELGVSSDTLEKYGAVSAQTAEEMVRGLARCSRSDICISVTGHAGPDTSDGLPVGLFYVGLCAFGKVSVKEYRARRTKRDDVRKLACQEMYRLIYEALK